MQKKLSRFKFEIPLQFEFNAPREIENDDLYKLALKHLDIALKIQIFDVDEKRLEYVNSRKILTPKEKEEKRNEAIDQFLLSLRKTENEDV